MQEDGTQIISFDALFGLCRKKHASVSVRPPLYGTTFFEKQEEVDQYVRSYDTVASSLEKVYLHICISSRVVCTSFLLYHSQIQSRVSTSSYRP